MSSQVIISSAFAKTIILISFLTLIIIILFKALNIRLKLKIGYPKKENTFKHDKKLAKIQHKINKTILQKELKHHKRHKR